MKEKIAGRARVGTSMVDIFFSQFRALAPPAVLGQLPQTQQVCVGSGFLVAKEVKKCKIFGFRVLVILHRHRYETGNLALANNTHLQRSP